MPQLISTLRVVHYAIASRARAIASRARAVVRRLACAVLPHREWSYGAGSEVGNWAGGIEVPVLGNVAFVDKDGTKSFRW